MKNKFLSTLHLYYSAISDNMSLSAHIFSMARKYGEKSQQKVERALHEMKRGELKSGKSGKTVHSRKQAIAIGLSEARRAGGKVPNKK